MADSKLESTSSIPAMDIATLYAGGDFDYLEDDRSTENTDDEGAVNRGDELPEPTGAKKRKAEAEENEEETDESDADTESDDEDPDAEGTETDGDAEDPDSESGESEGGGDGDEEGENRVGTVPKWRLDQQTKKFRQAEREKKALQDQLDKLTGKTQNQPDTTQQPQNVQATDDQTANQLKELQTKRNEIRDQYEEAIIDGDSKKTKALRGQLDAIEDDIFEVRVSARTQRVQEETVSRASIEAELQKVADVVQKEYTVLDPNHESYDEEIVNEVVGYRDMLIRSMGRKPGEALQEAAETMAKKYDIEPATKTTKKPTVKRTEQRSKGKEKVAKQQPPKMPGKKNEPKISDVTTMTDKEFDKLSPEQRAELRGDYRVQ